MLRLIILILAITFVQIAHYLGQLHGLAAVVCTIVLLKMIISALNRVRRMRGSHESVLFQETRERPHALPLGRRGKTLYLTFGLLMCAFMVGQMYWDGRVESPLNEQKVDEIAQRNKADRQTFQEHNKNAFKAYQESRGMDDQSARKPKLQEALQEAEAALEFAEGIEKAQLLNIKALLLQDLDRLPEARKAFSEYMESGGDKVDFPRALYEAGLYEQSQAALQLVLAKKRPCEATILEAQLLFKLDQGEEASNRFFDLRTCRNKPFYDDLKAQYEEFQAKND